MSAYYNQIFHCKIIWTYLILYHFWDSLGSLSPQSQYLLKLLNFAQHHRDMCPNTTPPRISQ